MPCIRCQSPAIFARFHCKPCWQTLHPGQQERVPRKRIAAPKRIKPCVRCGVPGQIRAQGHCRKCWHALHPELRQREMESRRKSDLRERLTLSRLKPPPLRPDQPRRCLGEPVPTVCGVPVFTVGRGGIPLATLHDPDAADRERERRVAIYARMVEQYGEILWGQIPPPGDDG